MNSLESLINRRGMVLLDSAMGTQLQEAGMPGGASPELWALEHPEILQSIHRRNIRAGSNILYSATFGGSPFKMAEYGREKDVREINRRLTRLARETADEGALGDHPPLVAGDIGPTGHFMDPFGEMALDEAVRGFREQIAGLREGGADLLVIETMMDIQEARAALIACREEADLPVLVTMTVEKDGRTLGGTTPEAAAVILEGLGASALGLNCSTGPAEMLPLIRRIRSVYPGPLAAKPNAGMPVVENGKTRFPMGGEEFGRWGIEFRRAGVDLLGGCCGTTDLYIQALRRELDSAPSVPAAPEEAAPRTFPPCLASPRRAVPIPLDDRLFLIGERINPTGKKQFQAALREGRFSEVSRLAREQARGGADFLDVNAGMPGIDEEKTVLEIIRRLSPQTELPLVIDSSRPDVLESALRLYPGRALINSVSGEKEKMEAVLPLAARYGSMLILLPLDDRGIPETLEERQGIIRRVLARGKEWGIGEDRFLVDGLVMTVSSQPEAPQLTLDTIGWCRRQGLRTAAGLSNVSFGLPGRKWVNASFLAMAAARGLTAAIANPGAEITRHIRGASEVLAGRDPDAGRYIASHRDTSRRAPEPGKQPAEAASSPSAKADPPPSGIPGRIHSAILHGERDSLLPALEEALSTAGEPWRPSQLLQDIMIPAILQVGELYDRKEYFLPQLIASAETMKKGFSRLEPLLERDRTESTRRGRIVFATVKGDIHDIGKNIVVLLMRNYGFEVTDLGKDVAPDRIASEALSAQADIVALSALMTTTMIRIPETLQALREAGFTGPVMAGGAVVTREWAEETGVFYSADGVEAVSVAERLISGEIPGRDSPPDAPSP